MVPCGLCQALLPPTGTVDQDTAAPINCRTTAAAPKTGRYCGGALHHCLAVVEETALQRQPESRARRYQAVHVDEARIAHN